VKTRLQAATEWAEFLYKYEAHAVLLVVVGLLLKLKAHDDMGLILAGAAIFKGRQSAP
jgi:hypothetical protein